MGEFKIELAVALRVQAEFIELMNAELEASYREGVYVTVKLLAGTLPVNVRGDEIVR